MHKSITEERLCDAVKREMFGTDNPGFCISCGIEQDGCEPDAEEYECENCGECAVYGAAQLLMQIVA